MNVQIAIHRHMAGVSLAAVAIMALAGAAQAQTEPAAEVAPQAQTSDAPAAQSAVISS